MKRFDLRGIYNRILGVLRRSNTNGLSDGNCKGKLRKSESEIIETLVKRARIDKSVLRSQSLYRDNQEIYLGDMTSYINEESCKLLVGIDSDKRPLYYNPANDGNLMIISDTPYDINKTIETLCVGMHLLNSIHKPNIYAIDIGEQLSFLDRSEIVKERCTDPAQAERMLNRLIDLSEIKSRIMIMEKSSFGISNNACDYIIIPELYYLLRRESKKTFVELLNRLVRLKHVGVHFIIGTCMVNNEVINSVIRPSIGVWIAYNIHSARIGRSFISNYDEKRLMSNNDIFFSSLSQREYVYGKRVISDINDIGRVSWEYKESLRRRLKCELEEVMFAMGLFFRQQEVGEDVLLNHSDYSAAKCVEIMNLLDKLNLVNHTAFSSFRLVISEYEWNQIVYQ